MGAQTNGDRDRHLDLTHEDGEDPSGIQPDPVIDVAPDETNTGNIPGPPELPLLLAGPIVRRAAPDAVLVWVATSVDVAVTGRVYQGTSREGRELGGGEATTLRFGAHLYIKLVRLTPAAGQFPRQTVLGYDLRFTPGEGQVATRPGGLIAHQDLLFRGCRLPTFVLDPAPESTALRVVHASCRKLLPASETGPDAIEHLHGYLSDTWQQPHGRPSALILTGDQIYADDVNDDLLRVISRLAPLLMGFQEVVPSREATSGEGSSGDPLPTDRAQLVRSAHLTVDEAVAHSHLLSLGEFAAMYLLSWSPALYDLPWVRDTLPGALYDNLRSTALKMRRVLAHAPTYMVLDDHEVTDDWPMDQNSWDEVLGDGRGRWIIANGLIACWAFQLKGNDPALRAGGVIERALRQYVDAGLSTVGADAAAQRRLVDVAHTTARTVVEQAKAFHFVTPTSIPILFVDTRTQRSLHRREVSPGLLDGAGRNAVRRLLGAFPAHLPMLVVSPAPVLENPGFVIGQSTAGFYEGDKEGWARDGRCYRSFLALLEGRRPVVVLSGDVHHSYVSCGEFSLRDGGPTTRIFQLTCSAMRNKPTGAALAGLEAQNRAGVIGGLVAGPLGAFGGRELATESDEDFDDAGGGELRHELVDMRVGRVIADNSFAVLQIDVSDGQVRIHHEIHTTGGQMGLFSRVVPLHA
jgi:hypothetical protein